MYHSTWMNSSVQNGDSHGSAFRGKPGGFIERRGAVTRQRDGRPRNPGGFFPIPGPVPMRRKKRGGIVSRQTSFPILGNSPTNGAAYVANLFVIPFPALLMWLRGMFLVSRATSCSRARKYSEA